jgi:thioredoxin-related protein
MAGTGLASASNILEAACFPNRPSSIALSVTGAHIFDIELRNCRLHGEDAKLSWSTVFKFLFLLVLPAGPLAAAEKIAWIYDLDAGLAAAKKENKPVMIDFMADWCAPCKQMDKTTFSHASILRKSQSFIPVRIDIEKQRQVAARYKALARAYGGIGIPNMLFLTGDGKELKHIVGFQEPGQLLAVMNAVLRSNK